MKKDIIRREFFKLRIKQKSYSKCQQILKEEYNYAVSIRTLKRWQSHFSQNEEWNLRDISTKPQTIHYKVTDEAIQEVLDLREKTEWGAHKLVRALPHLGLSSYTINLILRKNDLTRKEHNRGQRIKYVRFQRKHANLLWHIDDSEFGKRVKLLL